MEGREPGAGTKPALVPTRHELELLQFIRNWRPKTLSKALSFAEECALYGVTPTSPEQTSRIWMVRQLGRCVRRCRKVRSS